MLAVTVLLLKSASVGMQWWGKIRLLDAAEIETMLPKFVAWQEQQNLYREGQGLLSSAIHAVRDLKIERGQDLGDWNKFWALENTKSTIFKREPCRMSKN